MNARKIWRTIWPSLTNVELVKGVGQFPYHAALSGLYNSGIVCYENEDLSLKSEVPGVEIIYLKKGEKVVNDVCKYLIRNSSCIDVLHSFHIRSYKLVPFIVFKLLNKKGKIWLDTDSNPQWLESFDRKRRGTISERIDFFKDYLVLRVCDLISAPTTICARKIEEIWNLPRDSVAVVPYGYIDVENTRNIFNKERVFLCACRLGAHEKNVELLINAFGQTIKDQDWKLVLVGTITKSFSAFLAEKKEKYGIEEGRIEYRGVITDRKKLYDEYSRAAVFVLPSRYESFGIVTLEALSRGCYLLECGSLPLFHDLVKDKRTGDSFGNNKLGELKRKLIEVSNSPYFAQDDIKYRSKLSEKYLYPYLFDAVCEYLG